MSHANRKKPRISAVAAAGALAVAGGTLVASWAAVAQAAPAKPAAAHMPAMPAAEQTAYSFTTLGSHHDRTFNQLLGINNEGLIAGYFGLGSAGHPNKGYTIRSPYAQGDISNENFTNSKQTQVTGLNDTGVTVGFFSTQNNANLSNNNFGWYNRGGHFHEVNFPTGTPANPPVDQLLGVNNHDVAVGFFINAAGLNRGYTYNINTKKFSRVLPPGATNTNLGGSLAATAINNNGDVAGSYVTKGVTDAFLKLAHGPFIQLAVNGATATQAFGVNDSDWVVGAYTTGPSNAPVTHGFVWIPKHGFTKVDDPNGAGTTTLNGINNEGDLVGFYTDSAGNVDGLLAYPGF
jgi:hypothetical protein